MEISQGLWERLHKHEVYTREHLAMVYNLHQDFHAPGGESQRQVEFRMMDFINNVILNKSIEAANLHIDSRTYRYTKHSPSTPTLQIHPLEDNINNCPNMLVSKSKNEAIKPIENRRIHASSPSTNIVNDGSVDKVFSRQMSPYNVLIISHEMAIKCLLKGILGSSAHMTNHICIDNASITMLSHSTHVGWRVMHVNNISHLE